MDRQPGSGTQRALTLPGRTDTIGEMIDAMTKVAGPEPESRITWDRDPRPSRPSSRAGARTTTRGAPSRSASAKDASFEDSVRFFLEDDIRAA